MLGYTRATDSSPYRRGSCRTGSRTVIPFSTTWNRRPSVASGTAARIARAAVACSAATRATYARDDELAVSSRLGPRVAKKPGPLAAASEGSRRVAITVTRPDRCAAGTRSVPFETRGTVISPNVRSTG